MFRIFGWMTEWMAGTGSVGVLHVRAWERHQGTVSALLPDIQAFRFVGKAEGISGGIAPLRSFLVITLQPSAWWLLAIVPLLAVLAVVVISRKKMQLRLLRQKAQIERQREQIAQMNGLLKLKILQARMNPHFLFNSLNAVQYFINADEKKPALQYVSRFASFLRKMIQHGDDVSISLRDEVDLLNDYLILEQSRFPDRFTYEIKLPEELWLEDIPPFLTHSLLEDALYRGVLNLGKQEQGKITVALSAHENGVRVEVTDNGISFTRAQEPDDKRDMLARRIQLYNQLNAKQISLASRSGVKENDGWLNRAVLTIR